MSSKTLLIYLFADRTQTQALIRVKKSLCQSNYIPHLSIITYPHQFAVLGIDPMASHILDWHSTTK